MIVTSGSFLSVMFFTSLFISLIWIFARKTKLILQTGVGVLIGCVIIVIGRLLFPFEISFSNNIAVPVILPNIVKLFSTPIGNLFDHVVHYSDIIYFIWVVGIIIKAIYTTHIYGSFKKSLKSMTVVSNYRIDDIVEKLSNKYPKISCIKIIKTNWVSTPMIFGLLKPTIILPEIEFADDELRYILHHEITHYYNKDIWIRFIIELLCIVYWWNPFVYILKKQISRILEVRTDIQVTKSLSEIEEIDYLKCLLKIAKTRLATDVNRFAVPFTYRGESGLVQRSDMILNNVHKTKVRVINIIVLLTIVLILIFISLSFSFEAYSIDTETANTTFELTNETSFLIDNNDGTYDVYLNNNYIATIPVIEEPFTELPIYKNIEESKK